MQASGSSIMMSQSFLECIGFFCQTEPINGRKSVCTNWTRFAHLKEFVYPNEIRMFHDNNATCFQGHTIREWFNEHCGKFQNRIWSPRTLDRKWVLCPKELATHAEYLTQVIKSSYLNNLYLGGCFHRQSWSSWHCGNMTFDIIVYPTILSYLGNYRLFIMFLYIFH